MAKTIKDDQKMKAVKGKLSETDEHTVGIAVQVFRVNKREVGYLTKKYKDSVRTLAEWEEVFEADDIMYNKIKE